MRGESMRGESMRSESMRSESMRSESMRSELQDEYLHDLCGISDRKHLSSYEYMSRLTYILYILENI